MDTTVCMAAEAGSSSSTLLEPDLIFSVHNAMTLLRNGVLTFTKTCVEGVQANAARCEANLAVSTAFATELVSTLGYEAAAQIVKERLAS
ncbi:hypothetical protein [Rhizobium mongolense]